MITRMYLSKVRVANSKNFHQLTVTASSGLQEGPTSDGDGFYGTDAEASMSAPSLRSVPSDASIRSTNIDGRLYTAPSKVSRRSVSSDASMRSINSHEGFYVSDNEGSVHAFSNISLFSASSNASMRSNKPNASIHSNPSKKSFVISESSVNFPKLFFF